LTGAGTLSGTVVVSGTHSPGDGVGIGWFTGNLTYGPASHILWSLNANTVAAPGTNYDQIDAGTVTGSSGGVIDIMLNGSGSTVDFTNSFWTASRTWTVISGTSVNGTFAPGSITHDHNGVATMEYGGFSVQQSATAANLLWTPTPYNQWRGANFGTNTSNPAIAGDMADPAGDGIPNVMKYALGLNPADSGAAGLPAASAGAGTLILTYTKVKSATDATYQPLWSPDLLNWYNTNITQAVLLDNGTTQQIQAIVPITGDRKLFMELQVTIP
jgi:hypothetical protein